MAKILAVIRRTSSTKNLRRAWMENKNGINNIKIRG